ncbi:hypothetical protein HDU89_004012 [Geranomyces variabilis]|nr:hypothetical protein HDU89_004012 [Geranomyces variabilis]
MAGDETLSGVSPTACYCEENAYNLIRTLPKQRPGVTNAYAVFVSSEIGWFEMKQQKAGKGDDGATMWDYHVFVINVAPAGQTAMVYDFDSLLPFPCVFDSYVAKSFPPSQLPRLFRVVEARQFLRDFASDRRHMRSTTESGETKWSAAPPTYPPIQSAIPLDPKLCDPFEGDNTFTKLWGPAHLAPVTNEHRLPLYIRMLEKGGPGRVVDLNGLQRLFAIEMADLHI